MMEKLSITNRIMLDSNLIRVADLIYFEGPLLVLYEDIRNNNFYLYDWVDRDNSLNRWLVYRIDHIALNDYIYGKINQLELYNSINNKKHYIAEIGENRNHNIFEIDCVPEKYLPPKEYFDISDSTNISKVKSAILKVISRRKSENEYFIPIALSNAKINRHYHERRNIYFTKNQHHAPVFRHEMQSVKIKVVHFNHFGRRNSSLQVSFNSQKNSMLNKVIHV